MMKKTLCVVLSLLTAFVFVFCATACSPDSHDSGTIRVSFNGDELTIEENSVGHTIMLHGEEYVKDPIARKATYALDDVKVIAEGSWSNFILYDRCYPERTLEDIKDVLDIIFKDTSVFVFQELDGLHLDDSHDGEPLPEWLSEIDNGPAVDIRFGDKYYIVMYFVETIDSVVLFTKDGTQAIVSDFDCSAINESLRERMSAGKTDHYLSATAFN